LGGSQAIPPDLIAFRDRYGRLLGAWNKEYFRSVDDTVLDALAANAEHTRSLVPTMSSVDLVEKATNGVVFAPEPSPDLVLLVPQWHFRPWNMFSVFEGTRLIQYPVEPVQVREGCVPPSLLRLTRALGDESRLRILRLLAEQSRSFTNVVAATGLSKATVNHHMMLLRAAGLVLVTERGSRRPTGPGTTYDLRESGVDALPAQLRSYLLSD